MRPVTPLLIAFILAYGTGVQAQEPYEDETTAVGWAWKQIRNDEIADFNRKCGQTLDSHVSAGWNDPCRQIPAQFLLSVLTKPEFRDRVPRHRVGFRGAHITGTLDLMDAEITSQVRINESRIDGNLILTDSRWGRSISLEGSTVIGKFSAQRMHADSLVLLRNNSLFEGEVDLSYAKIDGNLEMGGSTFIKGMVANSLHLGAGLFMSQSKFGGAVNLGSAKIDGELNMENSSFADANLNDSKVGGLDLRGSVFAEEFIASRLQVASFLFMNDHAKFGGDVNLNGAKINGVLDMSSSSFSGVVNADRLTVEGGLFMRDHARFGKLHLRGAVVRSLEMGTSCFAGDVNAASIDVAQNVFMNDHATFQGEIKLTSAKIGGNLEMQTSSFAGEVNANQLSVANALLMRDNATFGGEIYLVEAKVGHLEMEHSVFAKAIHASGLKVLGSFFMIDHSRFADVILTGAKIGRNLEMNTSTFLGNVTASGLSVEGSLLMGNGARFNGKVNLNGAKVGSNVEMDGSSFIGDIVAESLSVTHNLLMWHQASFMRPVNLIAAKVGGILDLSDATAAIVDLSGADAGQFLISGLGWWCLGGKAPIDVESGLPIRGSVAPRNHWPLGNSAWRTTKCSDNASPTTPSIALRNFHAGAFQDSPDAWPPLLDLEGFYYDRLGGLGGIGRVDMRSRSSEEWRDWLERDRTFSTQPYAQLSSVLAAAGHRDTADEIRLGGRERERGEAWEHQDFGSWVWLTVLSGVIGYGIGLYSFRVLIWVTVFTVLGAIVLFRWSPNARIRWCRPNAWLCGMPWLLRASLQPWLLLASLHRLLPLIKLSKEFDDFFDNPPATFNRPRRNLRPGLVAYFVVHAIVGWALGLSLLAAIAGLTPKG
jgi:hypothetical protein